MTLATLLELLTLLTFIRVQAWLDVSYFRAEQC